MIFESIKSCTINREIINLFQRDDGKYDVTTLSENGDEEYNAEGVDFLKARVEYANQVLFQAGAN